MNYEKASRTPPDNRININGGHNIPVDDILPGYAFGYAVDEIGAAG